MGSPGIPPLETGPGDDNGGKKVREKQAKQFLDDLTDCINSLYNVQLTKFEPAQHGMNGLFEGKDAKGNITVVNDVGSYTKVGIGFQSLSFTAAGWTPHSTARNQTNYTASDLDVPEMYPQIQIHELAHSLDQITSGSVFGSSEASADKLGDCVTQKEQSRSKGKH
jgi:hypothetical protein